MKNLEEKNLSLVSGGISKKDEDSIVEFAGNVGSTIGGTLGPGAQN
ncbi:hypothetical protein [Ursidibacter arcticus]|nr:hypothetical protein [Ursidibacter arcticus]